MWRLFDALCMLTVVALLGLHGGQARPLLDPPQLRSDLDGTNCANPDRGALGASARSLVIPASAGSLANWIPPAEIETSALVWQPPGEIARARTVAITTTASTALPARNWVPPAEIAAKAMGRLSSFAVRAGVWQPPVEISHAKTADLDIHPVAGLAVPASAELPASVWARPIEIAAEAPAIEHRSSFTGVARDWRPPAEIAPTIATVDGVDDIITGLANRTSPDRPRSNWAPPAETARLLPTSLGSAIANGTLVWRPPAEIAKSTIANQ